MDQNKPDALPVIHTSSTSKCTGVYKENLAQPFLIDPLCGSLHYLEVPSTSIRPSPSLPSGVATSDGATQSELLSREPQVDVTNALKIYLYVLATRLFEAWYETHFYDEESTDEDDQKQYNLIKRQVRDFIDTASSRRLTSAKPDVWFVYNPEARESRNAIVFAYHPINAVAQLQYQCAALFAHLQSFDTSPERLTACKLMELCLIDWGITVTSSDYPHLDVRGMFTLFECNPVDYDCEPDPESMFLEYAHVVGYQVEPGKIDDRQSTQNG
jgi:hypothetical protein